MRSAQTIIKRPLLTEKSARLRETGGAAAAPAEGDAYAQQVVFEVARDANKIEIRRAVQTLFKVTVTDVRTLVVRGKEKRVGRFSGQPSVVEEGVRHAEARRQHRVLRGRLAMAIKQLQADLAGPSRHVDAGLRRDHQARAREEPARAQAATGRPQQPRPHHVALPRRRPQAALPHGRLQAQQDRRAGHRARRSSTTRTARRASR